MPNAAPPYLVMCQPLPLPLSNAPPTPTLHFLFFSALFFLFQSRDWNAKEEQLRQSWWTELGTLIQVLAIYFSWPHGWVRLDCISLAEGFPGKSLLCGASKSVTYNLLHLLSLLVASKDGFYFRTHWRPLNDCSICSFYF